MKEQLVYPVCKPGQEPEFPSPEGLTGKELLISLCNLSKSIDSNDNKEPKEQFILKWCKDSTHIVSTLFMRSCHWILISVLWKLIL